MGRPSTREKKLKDGYYIEVRNKGSKSGIKIRRDSVEEMNQAVEDYSRSKDIVVLGESKNGKWVAKEAEKKKKKLAAKEAKAARTAKAKAAKG
ncbi:MAG: hypothetical protein ACPGVH_00995 [Chitinophagales bacterium]